MKTMIPILGVFVVMQSGNLQVFSYGEALARAFAGNQAFIQALGRPVTYPPVTYLELTQHRDGNTTTDAAIERLRSGR